MNCLTAPSHELVIFVVHAHVCVSCYQNQLFRRFGLSCCGGANGSYVPVTTEQSRNTWLEPVLRSSGVTQWWVLRQAQAGARIAKAEPVLESTVARTESKPFSNSSFQRHADPWHFPLPAQPASRVGRRRGDDKPAVRTRALPLVVSITSPTPNTGLLPPPAPPTATKPTKTLPPC